ncbi:class I SAM-dependent methyltransferase [Actinomadura rugatobispora]|uniref:Class I SAM-dependent methyltransferase n=1 Tax=Actinomadura rugatobispora TaxID=1994 RepID=A0ABW1A8Q6_9ACTN|nr:methyltransferase domain-containing protein [Actinomadura rugatobispora]
MSDGFGEMLRRCWKDGPARGVACQVIERDDEFVSVEDAYRYFTRPEEWVASEQRAVELARGRVLDVGCAAGRHMLELAGTREVIGIDPSPGAVAVARAQGLDARLGSVQEPGEVGTFDTIMLLGGNLGLLGSAREAPKVLGSLAKLARPGAELLAVGHDPYAAPLADHDDYHRHNRERGWLPGQVRMRLRYRGWSTPWFDRLLLSSDELSHLVDTSGLWAMESCGQPDNLGFYLAILKRKGAAVPADMLGG